MTTRTVLFHLGVTFVLALLTAALTTGLWSLVTHAVFAPNWPAAVSVAAILGGAAVANDVAGMGRRCAREK
jgi:hypothetical protein